MLSEDIRICSGVGFGIVITIEGDGSLKVYELARELKMESKSLLAKLKLWGIHAPSHMATLDERTVPLYRYNDPESDSGADPDVFG